MTESFQIYGRSTVKTLQNKKSSSRSILKFYLWKKKKLSELRIKVKVNANKQILPLIIPNS